MRAQRDAYANLNNQVLYLANQGVTINEIHNEYVVPDSLGQQWSARQYHGSEFHNSRAVLNRYLGYWDGNPATLTPLSPKDSSPLFVEMMGGADTIITRAEGLYLSGEYRLAMEILNKLIYAEPTNERGRNLLADVFEQLGYQYESSSLRNVFLASAQELRDGVKVIAAPRGTNPSLARAMTTSQWWDAMATRIDSLAADGNDYILNFVTPDIEQNFVIEMSSGTLSNIEGYLSENADATITINRSDLNLVIMGQATLAEQLQAGVGSIEGDSEVLQSLASVLTVFSSGFEILPGTLLDN
jgi:alkyl sulfatase BDS1-like metallo-beta-lactamase superfamily hydrolase